MPLSCPFALGCCCAVIFLSYVKLIDLTNCDSSVILLKCTSEQQARAGLVCHGSSTEALHCFFIAFEEACTAFDCNVHITSAGKSSIVALFKRACSSSFPLGMDPRALHPVKCLDHSVRFACNSTPAAGTACATSCKASSKCAAATCRLMGISTIWAWPCIHRIWSSRPTP